MHALRRLIRDQCDRRGWTQADLARASKLSPQLVSRLLKDDRDNLSDMPSRSTMRGLASAFGISEDVVLLAAADAYGIPVGSAVPVGDPTLLADEDLVGEVLRRLRATTPASEQEPSHERPPTKSAGGEAGSNQHGTVRRLRPDEPVRDDDDQPAGVVAALRRRPGDKPKGSAATRRPEPTP